MLHGLLIAGGVMAGLGICLSVILAVANKKLHVHEDPRIDDVEELLPAANCGACGEAGCRALAEKIVNGGASPANCPVNDPACTQAIADYLGVDAGAQEKSVARLGCAGGSHVAWTRAQYEGEQTCRGAALTAGGGKGCVWGCLGLGDCEVVCPFDAITMDEHGLPVVNEDTCTGCGDCVEVCPKNLFDLVPQSMRLVVACKSRAANVEAEAECQVACTGCGRCAMDAPEDLISIEDNLAVIDYDEYQDGAQTAIERCPTGAIIWLDKQGKPVKGPAACRVTRKSPLPIVS